MTLYANIASPVFKLNHKLKQQEKLDWQGSPGSPAATRRPPAPRISTTAAAQVAKPKAAPEGQLRSVQP